MVYYVKKGKVPEQRHTYDDRSHIFKEELFGLKAFDYEMEVAAVIGNRTIDCHENCMDAIS